MKGSKKMACEYSNDNGRLIVVAKKIGGIKK